MNSKLSPPDDTTCVEIEAVTLTFSNIKDVVGTFYQHVASDPLLQIPFQSVKDWPHHVEGLVHFWWTRFGGAPYMQISYNPAQKHFAAGFNQEFLSRWLTLFQEILDQKLTPAQAHLWGFIAGKMGQALTAKNAFYVRAYQSLAAPGVNTAKTIK